MLRNILSTDIKEKTSKEKRRREKRIRSEKEGGIAAEEKNDKSIWRTNRQNEKSKESQSRISQIFGLETEEIDLARKEKLARQTKKTNLIVKAYVRFRECICRCNVRYDIRREKTRRFRRNDNQIPIPHNNSPHRDRLRERIRHSDGNFRLRNLHASQQEPHSDKRHVSYGSECGSLEIKN